MNKKLVFIIVFGLLIGAAFTMSTRATAQVVVGGLPDIRWLGQGPGDFTVDPPRMLFERSRRDGLIQFVTLDETSHYEDDDDSLFSTDWWPSDPVLIRSGEINYGSLPAGCEVNYVQITDDLDPVDNIWYINGNLLQVVTRDWVSYGSFVLPEAGELTLWVEDSSAMIVELCVNGVETGTPVPTDVTPAVTASVTATDDLTLPTPTATEPVSQPTPTATDQAAQPSPTATPDPSVSTPTGTATALLGIIPTATNTPVSAAAATAVSTPAVIPPTGGGPGPREIALLGLSLLGALGLVSYGWWRLLRGTRQG